MRARIVLSILTIGLTLVLLSCESRKKPTIGLTLMTYNNPFFNVLKNVARKEVEKAGYAFKENDAEDDPNKQAAAIEDFLTQGVKAILLNPVDSAAIVKSVKEANRLKVPIICVDVKADAGELATFVASDNYELGVFTGEYLARRLNGKGKIAMVTYPTISSGKRRAEGCKSVLVKYPDIEIVAEQDAMGRRLKSMSVTESILTAHPDIDAIWAINDPTALGCIQAIKQAELQDKIFVVAIDGSPEAVEAIRKGPTFAATAAQYPQKIARMGVEMALRAIKGEKLPEFVPIRGALITKDNIDEYPGWTE